MKLVFVVCRARPGGPLDMTTFRYKRTGELFPVPWDAEAETPEEARDRYVAENAMEACDYTLSNTYYTNDKVCGFFALTDDADD